MAHAGLLLSFGSGQGKSNLAGSVSNRDSAVVLLATVDLLKTESVAQSAVQTNETHLKAATEPEKPVSLETSVAPEPPYKFRLNNLDVFLDADAVDQTARPDADFEIALGQRLPLRVESMVLEFWIDKDGITVQVRCLEGACNNELDAWLTKLAELRFAPAIKNGTPVASRKVMQIDPLPTFGL